MTAGAPDTPRLARLAYDAMGPRARVIPAIIVQGEADPVVKPINAIHTREMWLAMNALTRNGGRPVADGAPAAPARRTESQAVGLGAVTECYGPRTTSSQCEVEVLTVSGLGHAWSGGSKLGTFTDDRGPDATEAILRFLLAHPMPAGSAPNAAKP